MIGQRVDTFRDPEIPLSESPGTWRWPIGGEKQTNRLISGLSGATSKRESKGGFFAIFSYLLFLDILGAF
ncbi:uncharacterized protein AFUA_3G13800 [Aspergillus fumigatus Af293]|uniref:Uncharacterized protein n=1 Tax=Aspergillus fumigatus (strain ATCC MYA-4609 / CBS 101355 / FGSC A1100 / Af293) TaxID=330879 RepID=Q4WYP7_ASPFU|nr:hypothetical protein AFUA_3G13800 [Aspergillus fumigatus Af293]EAL92206.1 hypothetical protein AFUA_3G13800 [Aspergillus fumigatus Af293]